MLSTHYTNDIAQNLMMVQHRMQWNFWKDVTDWIGADEKTTDIMGTNVKDEILIVMFRRVIKAMRREIDIRKVERQ